MKGLILLKVTANNLCFATIGSLIMDSNFQDSVCYGCHVFTMLCVSISSVVIITIKNFDYCCIVHNISKSEAIKLLKSAILENGGYIYKNTVLNCSLFKAGFSYFFV